ncbi:methionyl-tRNA formyltransferase [Oscillospiraceae bacterium]|nr:methionyl-tRNA formyltransferase [Oscillospiraceae bacterium]
MNKSDLKIVFMGTPAFAATCLEKLCDEGYNVVLSVSQPDKPVGRKHILTPPETKVFAQSQGIEVFQPTSMKSDEAYEKIRSCEPDLLITAAYGKILPQRVLDIPKYGCLNVHASLLPKYRGAAPVQYSILNGDDVTGVTIMKMDAGMDTGDQITQVEVPIDINVDTDELMAQLAVAGSKLLTDTIPDWVDGKLKTIPQDESKVTLSPPITPDMGKFSWNETTRAIHDKVRALRAWPGAQTTLDGKKMKIYVTEMISSDELDASVAPGTVVKAHKGDLIVKTGDGFIKILELQAEGGKRLKAQDCAHNYKIGMRFGE